eukprot:7163534-Alexandrium_andersonii.AAC.1
MQEQLTSVISGAVAEEAKCHLGLLGILSELNCAKGLVQVLRRLPPLLQHLGVICIRRARGE